MGVQISDLVNDDASLISRKCWSSQAIYELEKRAIFALSWLYVGHESQLKSPGDFIQAYMAETPVIVARGEDNKIHVSLNSCSHRGLPVCRADYGNTKRFVCPYHNWSYTVEGKLVTIPQERELENCPDKSKLGLRQIPRIESWRGLIFASFNEDVESLEDYLGDMRFYLDAFIGRFDNGIEILGAPH